MTSTLGNEYPSSNETSKKNGTVRGDCIACDALFILDYPSHHFDCPLLLITGVYVNKFSRKLSGYKRIHVMSFYNETDIGLQNESNEGPV